MMSDEGASEFTMLDFIAPLRLLKNIGKEYFYELVGEYEAINTCDFPHELLNRPYINVIY
jgi:hypothetical protein